jgi:hypothetical protein
MLCAVTYERLRLVRRVGYQIVVSDLEDIPVSFDMPDIDLTLADAGFKFMNSPLHVL